MVKKIDEARYRITQKGNGPYLVVIDNGIGAGTVMISTRDLKKAERALDQFESGYRQSKAGREEEWAKREKNASNQIKMESQDSLNANGRSMNYGAAMKPRYDPNLDEAEQVAFKPNRYYVWVAGTNPKFAAGPFLTRDEAEKVSEKHSENKQKGHVLMGRDLKSLADSWSKNAGDGYTESVNEVTTPEDNRAYENDPRWDEVHNLQDRQQFTQAKELMNRIRYEHHMDESVGVKPGKWFGAIKDLNTGKNFIWKGVTGEEFLAKLTQLSGSVYGKDWDWLPGSGFGHEEILDQGPLRGPKSIHGFNSFKGSDAVKNAYASAKQQVTNLDEDVKWNSFHRWYDSSPKDVVARVRKADTNFLKNIASIDPRDVDGAQKLQWMAARKELERRGESINEMNEGIKDWFKKKPKAEMQPLDEKDIALINSIDPAAKNQFKAHGLNMDKPTFNIHSVHRNDSHTGGVELVYFKHPNEYVVGIQAYTKDAERTPADPAGMRYGPFYTKGFKNADELKMILQDLSHKMSLEESRNSRKKFVKEQKIKMANNKKSRSIMQNLNEDVYSDEETPEADIIICMDKEGQKFYFKGINAEGRYFWTADKKHARSFDQPAIAHGTIKQIKAHDPFVYKMGFIGKTHGEKPYHMQAEDYAEVTECNMNGEESPFTNGDANLNVGHEVDEDWSADEYNHQKFVDAPAPRGNVAVAKPGKHSFNPATGGLTNEIEEDDEYYDVVGQGQNDFRKGNDVNPYHPTHPHHKTWQFGHSLASDDAKKYPNKMNKLTKNIPIVNKMFNRGTDMSAAIGDLDENDEHYNGQDEVIQDLSGMFHESKEIFEDDDSGSDSGACDADHDSMITESPGFQVGDHIVYTFAHTRPPKTFSGTIQAIKGDKARIDWTNGTGQYSGPSEQDCQQNGIVNQIYDLHFARKIGNTNESQLTEKSAPGQEAWIKANKQRFMKEYGKKKGLEVLYATAYKRANKKDESVNEGAIDNLIDKTSHRLDPQNIMAGKAKQLQDLIAHYKKYDGDEEKIRELEARLHHVQGKMHESVDEDKQSSNKLDFVNDCQSFSKFSDWKAAAQSIPGVEVQEFYPDVYVALYFKSGQTIGSYELDKHKGHLYIESDTPVKESSAISGDPGLEGTFQRDAEDIKKYKETGELTDALFNDMYEFLEGKGCIPSEVKYHEMDPYEWISKQLDRLLGVDAGYRNAESKINHSIDMDDEDNQRFESMFSEALEPTMNKNKESKQLNESFEFSNDSKTVVDALGTMLKNSGIKGQYAQMNEYTIQTNEATLTEGKEGWYIVDIDEDGDKKYHGPFKSRSEASEEKQESGYKGSIKFGTVTNGVYSAGKSTVKEDLSATLTMTKSEAGCSTTLTLSDPQGDELDTLLSLSGMGRGMMQPVVAVATDVVDYQGGRDGSEMDREEPNMQSESMIDEEIADKDYSDPNQDPTGEYGDTYAYTNNPKKDTFSLDSQQNRGSDLNRPKNQFSKEYPGDNHMDTAKPNGANESKSMSELLSIVSESDKTEEEDFKTSADNSDEEDSDVKTESILHDLSATNESIESKMWIAFNSFKAAK